jgi:hypothetical protein
MVLRSIHHPMHCEHPNSRGARVPPASCGQPTHVGSARYRLAKPTEIGSRVEEESGSFHWHSVVGGKHTGTTGWKPGKGHPNGAGGN